MFIKDDVFSVYNVFNETLRMCVLRVSFQQDQNGKLQTRLELWSFLLSAPFIGDKTSSVQIYGYLNCF